jgi:hypothetical protein
MISPKLRIVLIVLFVICGIVAPFAQLGSYVIFAFWATALILLMGHFRHGPMLGILVALRKGDIPQAEALINTVKRPDWLSPRYQAYYHFSNALVASHHQDIDAAEKHSTTALELGYLHVKEKGILLYNLARVAFERKEFDKAKKQLAELQTLSVEDVHLKKRIEELEQALNKSA